MFIISGSKAKYLTMHFSLQIETNSSETEFEGVVCPCELKDNAGCLLKCESCGSLQHHVGFLISNFYVQ